MSRILSYIEVLQLDNFLQVLKPSQRILICQYRAGYTDELPKIVQLLAHWIEENRWLPPEFKYDPARELLYQENGEWFPVTKHELYRAEIIYK